MKFIGLKYILGMLTLFVSLSFADTNNIKQKVVYHINYGSEIEQEGALRNIQNHINAIGKENLELKVVLHGEGVSLLLDPDSLKKTKLKSANANDMMQAKISGLKDQGVKFKVCENTLKGKNINFEDDLYDVSKTDIVQSGVAELAILQSQGYAYIKP